MYFLAVIVLGEGLISMLFYDNMPTKGESVAVYVILSSYLLTEGISYSREVRGEDVGDCKTNKN